MPSSVSQSAPPAPMVPIIADRRQREARHDERGARWTPPGSKLPIVAAYWLFPGILAAAVLGNQPFEMATATSQVVALINDAAAVLILYGALRRKRWVFFLVASILSAKALRIASGSGSAEMAYVTLLNVLFCISGAIVAFQRPTLVYRQVMVICLLNFVAMVLQVTGAGAWTQLLTTHGEGNLAEPVSTLFVRADQVDYRLVQGRPAGISYSNVILSLIILFAYALHFSRSRGTVRGGTTLICAVAVLSMAKIALVGFFITAALVLLVGDRRLRLRMAGATVLFMAFLGLYAVLFPGLIATNLSSSTVGASFFYRANDIMAAINPSLRDLRVPFFEGTSVFTELEEGEFVSGYASLIARVISNLVPIAAVLAVSIGIFVLGFRRLRTGFPELTLKVILTIAMIGLFPATHPIWAAPIYWFMAGLGALPLVYLLRPRFIIQAGRARRPAPPSTRIGSSG